MPDYREIEFEVLDAQFDVSATVPDPDACRERYGTLSAAARQRLESQLDLHYGPTRPEVLDFFPANHANAPLHVFIHGGYWRRLSKEDFSFVAEPLVAAGAAVAVVEYARAPRFTISELLRQNRAAISWLYHHAQSLRFDRDRIHISGHSAGGQLVGMLLATRWKEDYGLPVDIIKGACAISGLFDLEPIRFTRINAWAQLDLEGALENSPLHHLPATACPLLVAYGGLETLPFRQQADAYAAACGAKDIPCEKLVCEDLDHFKIAEEFANRESALTRKIVEQMEQ